MGYMHKIWLEELKILELKVIVMCTEKDEYGTLWLCPTKLFNAVVY